MRRPNKKVYKPGYDITGHPVMHTKVEVFKKILAVNELGEQEQQFEPYKSIYTLCVPQTQKLVSNNEADVLITKNSYKFITRYDAFITADMKIIYNDKEHHIDRVLNPYNDRMYLEIFTTEV